MLARIQCSYAQKCLLGIHYAPKLTIIQIRTKKKGDYFNENDNENKPRHRKVTSDNGQKGYARFRLYIIYI